jgi:hypothetical protein
MNNPNYTGICPPEAFSTGGKKWDSLDATPAAASKKELIDVWYLEPLQAMSGHQAFICLSVCLFLYEKYLRNTEQIDKDETFSKGHKVFKQIGSDLKISADEAFEFWTCWRNGLAHHGMPQTSEKYDWGMTGEQDELVTIAGKTFTLNPWKIRDKIVNKISNKKQIWKDELAPLMKVFKIVKP